MVKTVWLGGAMAACSIEAQPDDQFLSICSPADDSGNPAVSIYISGIECIAALHSLIEDAIQDYEQRNEIAKAAKELRQDD